MDLEEIASTGDTQALAKTNLVIRKANELSGAAAETSIRLAEVAALHIEPSTRPGESRLLFTSSLTGAGKDLAPLSVDDVGVSISSADGVVLRAAQVGPDPLIVAVRADQPADAGIIYAASIAVRRFQNTSDPLGDTVQFGIACLNAAKQKVSERIFFEGSIVTADGLVSRQVTFSRDQPAELTLSETTRYVRPFVRVFGGNGTTDIVTIGSSSSSGLPGAKGDTGDLTPAAQAAAAEIKANTGIVEQNAMATANDRVRAEAAAGAATVNANVYPDVATGRAAVADGQQFQVVSGSETIRYRRDSSTMQTEVARFPTAAGVAKLSSAIGSVPSLAFATGAAGHFFDLTDLSTLFLDDLRAQPATRAGQVIKGIQDLSGNGNHGTTVGNPVLVLDENGFWCLELNGTTQYIVLPSGAIVGSSTGSATIIAAVQSKSLPPASLRANSSIYAEGGNAAGNNTLYRLQVATGANTDGGVSLPNEFIAQLSYQRTTGQRYATFNRAIAFDGTPRVIAGVDNAKSGTLYVDDSIASTAASFLSTITPENVMIGAHKLAGTVTGFFQGRIYCTLAVARALTHAERVGIQRWMAARCRVPGERSMRGSYTFYTDPRALSVSGRPVVGAVSPVGNLFVSDMTERKIFAPRVDHLFVLADNDHDNPAFLQLASDGRVLAFLTSHNKANYRVRKTVNPGDVTSWAAPIDIAVNGMLGTEPGGSNSYANPVQLSSLPKQPIFNFFRGKLTGQASDQRSLMYTKSLDDGSTWSTAVRILAGSFRPYFRVVQNGANRVDFICDDGNAVEQPNNKIYHFYMLTDGTTETFYKTDGTPLSLPINQSADLTPVYDPANFGGARGWSMDIAVDTVGQPVLAYATFPVPAIDTRYRVARFNGVSWSDSEVCKAGGPVDDASATLYSGGFYCGCITIDHDDVNVVYASRQVNGKPHQIWRYETEDNGVTWVGKQITAELKKAFRPFIVRGQKTEPRLCYVTGDYTDYSKFETRVKLVNSFTGL